MPVNTTDKSFFVMTLGVVFEHLDMMLVSLLAGSIAGEFVANGSPAVKLLYAYIGYAVAFLFRPLGAFVFGCLGDVYGRKVSLIGSMVLMSSATLALAFIPNVDMLGITATLAFFFCRIIQGFAVGGEYGTAMTYSYELNPRLRTFYGACVVSSTHVGGLCAGLLAAQYVDNFRIAFFIVGLSGFSILLFRSFIKEYYVTVPKKISEIAKASVKNRRAILEALTVASMLVMVFYGSLIYLNEIVHQHFGISQTHIFIANSFLLGLWVALPPCFGYVADIFSVPYRKIMRFGALGVFLSAPLLGFALAFSSWSAVLAAQILMHLFHMLFCLCTPRFFGDLFGGQARNTAISTSYSLGASFTAALAPLICHMTIVLFHTRFAVCIPFMLSALMVILILKKETVCDRKMILLSSTT